jgi:hypothetical protein
MDMGMNIQVRLYASLRKWSTEPLVALALPAGSTVREAIVSAGVPEHEVAIIMRNGRRGTLEEILPTGTTSSCSRRSAGGETPPSSQSFVNITLMSVELPEARSAKIFGPSAIGRTDVIICFTSSLPSMIICNPSRISVVYM